MWIFLDNFDQIVKCEQWRGLKGASPWRKTICVMVGIYHVIMKKDTVFLFYGMI